MPEVFELLRQLTLAKAEWTSNVNYQVLFEKEKSVIKEDACIKNSVMRGSCYTSKLMHLV